MPLTTCLVSFSSSHALSWQFLQQWTNTKKEHQVFYSDWWVLCPISQKQFMFQGNGHNGSIHARILPPPVVGRLSLPVPGINGSHQIRTAPILHNWSHRRDRINCALFWRLCRIARHVRHLGPALIALSPNCQNGPRGSTWGHVEVVGIGGVCPFKGVAHCLLYCLFGAYIRFILDLSGIFTVV